MAVELPEHESGGRCSYIKSRFAIRYLMAILGSVGLAIIYGFKVNLSIAIVAMVNHTSIALKKNQTISHGDNDTIDFSKKIEDGPFEWDQSIQGIILSAYFAGYLVSMIPGGRMAELLSAKTVMNGAVLLNVIASILSPISSQGHYLLLALMRFIQGVGGGFSFPAMHVMIAKWAPPSERSVLASIIYAGTALGTVIATFLTGMIAANVSWQAVFYIEGGLCLIWCTAWWFLIEDTPEQQKKFITKEEKEFILTSQGQKTSDLHHNIPVPWGQLIKSKPFIAIFIAHFCSNFGWYMLLIELPSYMNQVLKFNLESNTTLSSMPYLCMWFFTMLLSKVLSIIVDKKLISVTTSRKIGTFFCSVIPMICLLIVTFAGNNRVIAVTFMTIGVTCMGGMYSGFLANHIDIAPNFAGTLVALTNCFATIPGILVPLIVGYITEKDPSIASWRIIFITTAVLFLVEITIYCIFGSGEEQPWNNVKSNGEESKDQQLPLKNQLDKQ